MSDQPQPQPTPPRTGHEFFHKPMLKVNEAHKQSLNWGERLALFITDRVGTMGFFLIILLWTVLWLGWNLLAPPHLKFDPPTGFVFWLFISNLIQILLMPLIMVGQNLQGRHSELRAEHEYEVSLHAKDEIERIIARMDDQQAVLEEILKKMNENTASSKSTQ